MAVFSELQRAAFSGYEFPIKECDVQGGMRKQTHLYPHTPGGAQEKLQRLPYTVRMLAPLTQSIKGFPVLLYPDLDAILRVLFEGGLTFDLVIPTIGTIRAFATSWRHSMRPTDLNGVEIEVTFEEDSANLFLVENLVAVSTPALTEKMEALQEKALELEEPDLFESLQNLVNQITGLQDQIELQGQLISNKALQLSSMCQQLSETLDFVQDPLNDDVYESLKELWASALELHLNAAKTAEPIIEFLTPRIMTIGEVSQSLYGSNDRGADVLKLNAVADAFSIPAGTSLRAYAPAA